MADELQRDQVWREMSEIKTQLLRLESRVEGELKGLAPRDWVHTVLQPIQQSITRMELTVGQLANDAKDLFAEHKQMLRDKADREKIEWADKTPLGIVKRYAPAVALLVGLVALFRVLGTGLELWLGLPR